jgi:hypothetical protein
VDLAEIIASNEGVLLLVEEGTMDVPAPLHIPITGFFAPSCRSKAPIKDL